MDVTWVYIVLGVAYLGWIIFLSGIASVQANCGSKSLDKATSGYLGSAPCNTMFGFTWWIVSGAPSLASWWPEVIDSDVRERSGLPQVWFQLGVIIGCTVYIVRGWDRLRSALMSYLTVATVLTMSSANTYIYFNYAPEVKDNSAPRATAAGAVISSIAK